MTKTKDPRPRSWTCPVCERVVNEYGHDCTSTTIGKEIKNELETPKRCDECRWWMILESLPFGICKNKKIKVMTGNNIFSNSDFYCKYWEKKEDK